MGAGHCLDRVGDCLDVVRPDRLQSRFPDTTRLVPVGGAMAGARHHHATLGPFHEPGQVRFTFLCTFDGCSRVDVCCHPEERSVLVTANDR